jgi:rhodanese-related sulfurtransferase
MPSANTVSELAKLAGTARAPLLIDVRREQSFKNANDMIAGAIRCSPDNIGKLGDDLSERRPVVVYCAHGQEVSQGLASALAEKGVGASYLSGGIAAWVEQKLPVRRKREEEEQSPSKWVTRERPKIDRIACPWLIRRFIDPAATLSTCLLIAFCRLQAKPAPRHTTSPASSSRMKEITARSTLSCAFMALQIRRWSTSRGLFAAPIRPATN